MSTIVQDLFLSRPLFPRQTPFATVEHTEKIKTDRAGRPSPGGPHLLFRQVRRTFQVRPGSDNLHPIERREQGHEEHCVTAHLFGSERAYHEPLQVNVAPSVLRLILYPPASRYSRCGCRSRATATGYPWRPPHPTPAPRPKAESNGAISISHTDDASHCVDCPKLAKRNNKPKLICNGLAHLRRTVT